MNVSIATTTPPPPPPPPPTKTQPPPKSPPPSTKPLQKRLLHRVKILREIKTLKPYVSLILLANFFVELVNYTLNFQPADSAGE